jgi:1-acyl-sn-glycerol-3-phosphate acyltransferase
VVNAVGRAVAGDWERRAARGLAFLRRRITGDYEVDEFGFDAELTHNVLLGPLRPLYERYFRVEARGLDHIPDKGGALIVANHSGTLPMDALMTQVALWDHHPAGRHLRMLAADVVFTMPYVGELARKAGHTLACAPDAERLLRRGRGRRGLAGGVQGDRQALLRPLPAAALRPRRLRLGRAAHRHADHPDRDRRRRGDLSEDRRHQAAGPAAERALRAGDPDLPVARPARPGPAAVEVVPRVRRADRHLGLRSGAADDPMLIFNLTDQVREIIQDTLYRVLLQRRSVFF